VKFLVHVSGSRDVGPGERQEMLDRAAQIFEESDIVSADIVRIDVPPRGQSDGGEGALRPEVEPIVPALQSGSLFGELTGVLIMDAQNLREAEAGLITELLELADSGALQLVLVSAGTVPKSLVGFTKSNGDTISIRKLRERDVGDWLRDAARERKLRLRADVGAALVERFGTDIGALGQALDQLMNIEEPLTAEVIHGRFRNRPDEPMWYFADAVSAGDIGESLRRLHDFLTHTHPLVLLAFLENDLRKRALAAAAPDLETFAEWSKSKPDAFPVKKAWRARSKMTPEQLGLAVDALRRADETLKSKPEETHLVTLERLTVSLCYWYGRR
jgi:DNA polymerase III delta subunit